MNKKSIPVIGVPIVNGVHWLKRLIDSIDYPTDNLFIINNNGRDQITKELDDLTKIDHKFIKQIKVCHLPSNIGCSGAWNLIIKCYMMCPYWIIANHDICFSPGLLENMVNSSENEDIGIVKGKKFQWDLFLIKDFVIQECGLFDENFYPAYVEDCDYHIRLMLKNIETSVVDIPYLHGDVDYETTGSQTWRTDYSLKEKLDYSHDCNMYYIAEKWGSNWRDSNWEYHPYDYPYNNSSIPISYTTYDLKFVRRKNIGF
jgi:GT2 family glycosyltransferase